MSPDLNNAYDDVRNNTLLLISWYR